MKKKETIIGVVVAILVAIAVAAYLMGGNNSNEGTDSKVSKNTKGNHDVFECIDLISTENTVEEINDIIGFEGECTDEENKVYVWELSDDTSVRVQYSKYSSSPEASIEINFPSKAIANDKVDFSKFDEIKKAMNTRDSITYDEFVEKVGGVQGTLKYKSKGTLRYEWDRPDGGYLTGTFNESNKKCTFASGRF